MSESGNLEGNKINLEDKAAIENLLLRFTPYLKKRFHVENGKLQFNIADFNQAVDTLKRPSFKGLVNHMIGIHKSCEDFTKAVREHGLEVKNYDIPSIQRYYLEVGSYPNTIKNQNLNEPLAELKRKALEFVPLIKRTGLNLSEEAYSLGKYGDDPENKASIRMVKSGFKEIPYLFYQPGVLNIGEMFHEMLAWLYITDGLSKIPVSSSQLALFKKEKLGEQFFLAQAVLENPDLLYNIFAGDRLS